MALKTTVGGRYSDSFVTVDEAETYLSGLYEELGSWDDLETGAKEYRLRLAAKIMNMLPLRGRRVYCGQALAFPRTIQQEYEIIPEEVKQIQAEISYNVVHRAMISQPGISEGEVSASRVTEVSLGGLLGVKFDGKPATTGTLLEAVVRSVSFPIWMQVQPYVSQIRGRQPPADADECLTTTTTT